MEKTLKRFNEYVSRGMMDTAAMSISAAHRCGGTRTQKQIEAYLLAQGFGDLVTWQNGCMIANPAISSRAY